MKPDKALSAEEKTAVRLLSELTGIPEYRLLANDNGEYITKAGCLQAMEEYHNLKESGEIEQLRKQLLDANSENRDLRARCIGLDEDVERLEKEVTHWKGGYNASLDTINGLVSALENHTEDLGWRRSNEVTEALNEAKNLKQ
jgi:hypothetical protein